MGISRSTARQTLLFYVIMALPGPLVLMYLPKNFVVAGDATATAQRIADGMFTYRLLVLCDLVSPVGFLLLGWTLYHLFEKVDRRQAQLLVLFVVVNATMDLVDVGILLAPVVLQGRAAALSAFAKPQLDALVLGAMQLRGALLNVDETLWGLWLLPFGILVIKSGFIPKLIGVCLILGCVGWVIMSAQAIVFPHAQAVERVAFLLVQPGEILIVLWLIVKSVQRRPTEAPLVYAA